jgi:hypothetical protein
VSAGSRLLLLAAIAGALLVGAARPVHAQPGATPPSPDRARPVPKVDLYTFEVGELIFQKFGHAAICLTYDDARPDLATCFNYGITNYDAGGALVWGFLRGKQKFWVDAERLGRMMQPYLQEDRTIWKQRLPLTDEQARAVEAKLRFDVREENRYYYYDHFYDNCSSRLRDIIDDATGGKLRADTAGQHFNMTFREAGARGLGPFVPVLALGDFLVGRALSKTPTAWEAMFLPDVLRAQIERSFGVVPEVMHQRTAPRLPWPTDRAPPASFGRWATFLMALLFALPLLLAQWRGRFERAALAWAMIPLALWGILIWGVVAISAIPSLRWNEAALVLMPIDLIIPLLGPRKRRLYALGRVALLLLVSLLCAIDVFKAPIWVPIVTAFLPLVILGFDLPRMRPLPAAGTPEATHTARQLARAAAAASSKPAA